MISSRDIPFANQFKTSATEIRVPLIMGLPNRFSGLISIYCLIFINTKFVINCELNKFGLWQLTFPRLAKEPIFKFSFICDPRSFCFQLFVFRYQDSGSFARRVLAILLFFEIVSLDILPNVIQFRLDLNALSHHTIGLKGCQFVHHCKS